MELASGSQSEPSVGIEPTTPAYETGAAPVGFVGFNQSGRLDLNQRAPASEAGEGNQAPLRPD